MRVHVCVEQLIFEAKEHATGACKIMSILKLRERRITCVVNIFTVQGDEVGEVT